MSGSTCRFRGHGHKRRARGQATAFAAGAVALPICALAGPLVGTGCRMGDNNPLSSARSGVVELELDEVAPSTPAEAPPAAWDEKSAAATPPTCVRCAPRTSASSIMVGWRGVRSLPRNIRARLGRSSCRLPSKPTRPNKCDQERLTKT